MGQLAHDIRDGLNTALIAFNVVKGGTVSISGNTGAVLGRSLLSLRIGRQLTVGHPDCRQSPTPRAPLGDGISERDCRRCPPPFRVQRCSVRDSAGGCGIVRRCGPSAARVGRHEPVDQRLQVHPPWWACGTCVPRNGESASTSKSRTSAAESRTPKAIRFGRSPNGADGTAPGSVLGSPLRAKPCAPTAGISTSTTSRGRDASSRSRCLWRQTASLPRPPSRIIEALVHELAWLA